MLGFLMTPLYLRKFEGAAVYGVYTNFYAWASMLNNVLAFGMETTYFRYLEKVDAADRPKVYNNSFVVTLITSVFLLSMAFTFTPAIAAWFSQDVAAAEYNIFVQLFARSEERRVGKEGRSCGGQEGQSKK